jgi:hypothetical protein
MGLIWPDVSFLLAAQRLGVSFESTLMVGRQNLFCDVGELRRGFHEVQSDLTDAEAVELLSDGFAEALLHRLGAEHVDSLDASDFEGSSILHDLNSPLPQDLRGRYSAVLDAGTLEHVFNVPEALRSCMAAVAPGGHLLAISPANNFFGHGFYQFSPELFYRVMTPANGFEVTLMLSRAEHPWAKWLAVRDPAAVGSRVQASGAWQTMLYVIAHRLTEVEPLRTWPQQSDYASAWDARGSAVSKPGPGRRAFSLLPARARGALRMGRRLFGTHSGPDHWQPVELSDLVAAEDASKLP